MYVCVCNAVTDKQIREAVSEGACSLQDLSDQLKVATCCGRCAGCAQQLLSESRTQQYSPEATIMMQPSLA